MTLRALPPREASIFACFADAVVAPAPPLPPVRDTDAVAFFDDWLARAPRRNRLGLRAALLLVELSPLASRHRRRLRRLAPGERRGHLERLDRSALRPLLKLVRGTAHLAYYGDDGVMGLLGYDADANVARGRALRRAEGRW